MRSLHTPQQETNVAYNPGVTFRGGEFIAQGISQAGNAITAGLQRFAQNREESAALDMSFQTRAQPLLEEMQKFSAKDGQVSPAASLVDKGADWHKFSSSQKKAFLADVVIMGDKQDRARRQQQEDDFRKDAQQFRQDQLTATERHRRVVEEQGAANALQSARNQDLDNLRLDERLGMDRQNFANLQEARRAKLESDTLMAGNLANFQRLAAEPTGPSRMGGDAAAALLSQPGTRLPDFSAYGPQDTQLTRQPLSLDRVLELGTQTGAAFHPHFDNYAKLYQGRGADADHVPRMVTLGGVNTIYSPKGGQFQIAPNSSLPDDLPEVRGHTAVPNGRGGVAYVPNGELTDTQRHARLAGQERVLLNSISRALSEEEKTGYRRQLRGVQEDIRNLESGGAKPAPAPSGAAGVAKPTSQAEFDALPSGAEFVNPATGQKMRKK